MRKPLCFYLPLEPVASRYTHDLCNEKDGWMTATLRSAFGKNLLYDNPSTKKRADIKTGAVLDAYTRSAYAMEQCREVCALLDDGTLKTGDILYLQDFWTPGLESILYCANMCKVELRIYAMVHAQSVDRTDFTYQMRSWMRPIELGYAASMAGLFVASTVHKDQLRLAGVTCPVHVVSLPYNPRTRPHVSVPKEKLVVFTSRIDKEKQPDFMLAVAKKFLTRNPGWQWAVTTSASSIRTYNNQDALKRLRAFRAPGFKILEGLSKDDYHSILSRAKIHFNSSLQDYVSWTLLESSHHRCVPVFPNYMSFPEILPPSCLYKPWSVNSALLKLEEASQGLISCVNVHNEADAGRQLLGKIVARGSPHDLTYRALDSVSDDFTPELCDGEAFRATRAFLRSAARAK